MDQNTIINPNNINISEYNYALPEEKIAKYPLERRDESKLLIYKDTSIRHTFFREIPSILEADDLLVMNDTKVIHSRLLFRKSTGAVVEVFCLEPHEPLDYVLSLQSKSSCKWKCLVGNLKRWKEGNLYMDIQTKDLNIKLVAQKTAIFENYLVVEFFWDAPVTFAHILEITGETPIPPYLKRTSESIDKERYQTVYSREEGSVAAPTAGLHFSDDILKKLSSANIHTTRVTLHVGAGTFKPVQTEKVADHEMHSEFFTVTRESLINLMKAKGIVSVGTTTLRTLESLYWLAVKIRNKDFSVNRIPELNQWEAYQLKTVITYQEAIQILLSFLEDYHLENFSAKTKIMILPGYKIKSSGALITNFHQPKSTLLLLVSAFIGENWKKVYAYALENEFRFLSYGDSSILFRSLDIQSTMT